MHEVLVVYQQIEMQFDEDGNLIIPQGESMIHTVSCDEKPDKIKCLIWEGDGFLLRCKRLLDGRYQWPRTKQEVMEMSQEQFAWLMSGQTILPSIRKAKPKNML